MKNILTGKAGETAAIKYLKKQGYKILAANYRCPYGEIDVIAKDKNYLIFLEIKTRTGSGYGAPQEAVTISKQRKISRLAWYYLLSNNLKNQDCRFDVVAVNMDKDGNFGNIEHLKNAFSAIEF